MQSFSQIKLIIMASLLLVLGCSNDSEDDDPGDGNGNNTVGNNEAPSLDELNEDNICYEVDQDIAETTSKVMLLQDISSSMNNNIGNQTKWEIARDALTAMVTLYGDTVQFGLDFFPIDRDCGVGTLVDEDTAPNNGDNLANVLANTQTLQSTPLLLGMANFLDPGYAPAFLGDGADPYLIVVSDGADSCDNNGNDVGPAELTDVTSALLNAGIQTFVIGFGSEVEPAELNAIAQAGGTPFDTYFDAQNEDDLNQALESIGQAVIVSCRYQLGTISEDANRDYTNIYFDGTPLSRGDDCSGGADWTWGNDEMTVIEFCQDACDLLENGGVEALNVIIMCSQEDVVVV